MRQQLERYQEVQLAAAAAATVSQLNAVASPGVTVAASSSSASFSLLQRLRFGESEYNLVPVSAERSGRRAAAAVAVYADDSPSFYYD